MFRAGKSQDEVASIYHVSGNTLRRWMRKVGIPPRTREESNRQGKMTRYESSHERKRAFKRAMRWVDSLTEMPTEDDIEAYSNRTFKPVDIKGMIDTRVYRELSKL